MNDLKYLTQHGTDKEKSDANAELHKMNKDGSILGDTTKVVFDANTATMHVQDSNKPINNLVESKVSMKVHPNVPKPITAPVEYMS